jgi:hypothetical protein
VRPQVISAARHDESDWDRLCDETDVLMQTGRFPGRHEAFQEAVRLNPNLNSTPPSNRGGTAMRPSAGSLRAEAELDRLTRELQQQERGLTYAQGYARVLAENPALYARYLEERQAQGGLRG